jgi:hypothetical protein
MDPLGEQGVSSSLYAMCVILALCDFFPPLNILSPVTVDYTFMGLAISSRSAHAVVHN